MLPNFEYQPPIMQNRNCFNPLYQNPIQTINNKHPYPQSNQKVQSQNNFRNQARQSRNDRFDNNMFQTNYDTRNIQQQANSNNYRSFEFQNQKRERMSDSGQYKRVEAMDTNENFLKEAFVNKPKYLCLVDTRSSISLIRPNILNTLPSHETSPKVIHTMIGKVILGTTREINAKPLTGKPGKFNLFIHYFSTKYDILIGRDILELTKAHINFDEEYVMLSSIIFNFTSKNPSYNINLTSDPKAEIKHNYILIKNDENLDEKLENNDFNYELNEKINCSNKIRISHLNSEERKSIMHQ